jgi:CHASE2 domain-containing sensor protein
MAPRFLRYQLAERGALLGLVCGLVAWLVAPLGLVQGLEDWLQDGAFSYRGKRPSQAAAKIVLLALDDDSLADLKKPAAFISPELAKVIYYLHEQKAGAIGIDLILHDSLRDSPDVNLQAMKVGEAVDEARHVVLPEALLETPPLYPHELWYLKRLRDEPPSKTDFGFVDVTLDNQYLRRQLLTLGQGTAQEHCFALALLAASGWAQVTTDEGLCLDGQRVPLDAEGKLRINFVGAPGEAFAIIPFRDALAAAEGKRRLGTSLTGAIVIVGVTARSQQDYLATPYANLAMRRLFRKEAAFMSGSEAHAHLLATLADRAYIQPLSWVMFGPVLLFAGAGLGCLYTLLGLGRGSVLVLAQLGGWWVVSLIAFDQGYWRIDLLPMFLLGLACYLTCTVRRRVWPWSRGSAKFDVFLSYRREGGAQTARLIKERLARDGVRAFLDADDLPSGFFDVRLLERITAARNFVVILSPGSLDRCHGPDDWLRREIAHALQQARNVIPVLLKGFAMPPLEELPQEIRALTRCEGVSYHHEHFRGFMKKLLGLLR